MDQLSVILERFSINANVFFSGKLCGFEDFSEDGKQYGHLHLLKSGRLTLIHVTGEKTELTRPTVMFVPRGVQHRFIPDKSDLPQLVCANISYQDNFRNPLVAALPQLLLFPLDDSELLSSAARWVFDEAFSDRCGRRVMIDRLCDIFLIQVLRHVLEQGSIDHGMMAGLSHPQLAKVLMAIHEQPQHHWTLDTLAEQALMSRSKFAEVFRNVVGQTPGDYILDWRVSIAQGLLKKNKSVALVANEVGYENGSALARVFRKKTGLSPREWLEINR
ncbi:MAG: AraC family transcriptional regulator [Amphritea sp.]